MKIILNSSIIGLVTLFISSSALADPPVVSPNEPIPPVFCIRITDMETVELDDGTLHNDFVVQFETLNWTNRNAGGLYMATNIATHESVGEKPTIVGIGVDRDGRGGNNETRGEVDASGSGLTTGSEHFDTVAIHSGRGRGDLPVVNGIPTPHPNDWGGDGFSATSARWSAGDNGHPVPFRDLIGASALGGDKPIKLIPGLGRDAIPDTAVDGGPTPYTDSTIEEAGQPDPDGSGNVLDGFTLTISDWEIDETLSLNWFLLDSAGNPIGTSGGNPSNSFGFGTLNLIRIRPDGLVPTISLLEGNTGFNQSEDLFFDNVFKIIDTEESTGSFSSRFQAEFAGEVGASITAGFANQTNNTVNATINTFATPVPPAALLLFSGLALLRLVGRRIH